MIKNLEKKSSKKPKNLLELKTKLSIVFLVKYSIKNFSPKKRDEKIKKFFKKTSAIFLNKKSR